MRQGKDFANLLALYTFYTYQAKLQKTNQPLYTDEFTAYEAQKTKEYGAITALALKYEISRKFVYILIYYRLQSLLPLVFASSQAMKQLSKKEIFSKILSYRLIPYSKNNP
jgi:hypothetical protein